MKKIIGIVVLTLVVSACGAGKKAAGTAPSPSDDIALGKSEVLKYQSLGNGVATIDLIFFKNNTFHLRLESIPQPDDAQEPIQISEKGRYTTEGNWNILNFKNPSFSAASVFDKTYSTPGDFEVLDKQTVKVNTALEGIMIWGIFCEKIE